MLAFGFIADAEQATAIATDNQLGNFSFGRSKERRPQLERTRVQRVQCAAVLFLARNDPQRGVVGAEALHGPSLGVPVKRMLGDAFEIIAVVATMLPDQIGPFEP